MTSGQISYDLRRLRAHQIIERIPHSRSYQVTTDGLTIALFLTRVAQRLLIPGLTQLTDPGPPPGTRLRQAARAYQAAITELAQQASIAA
jgi:predicted MarR family transcription regulator